MQMVNEVIKTKIGTQEKPQIMHTMKEMFSQYMYAGNFKNFNSPLSPSYSLLEPRYANMQIPFFTFH